MRPARRAAATTARALFAGVLAAVAPAQGPESGPASAPTSRPAFVVDAALRALPRLGAEPPALEGLEAFVAASGRDVAAGEIASFGVPFAEAAGVANLDGFVVVDDAGRAAAPQWRALARWNAARDDARAPLRFALLTLPAPEARGGRGRVVLRARVPSDPPPAPPIQVVADDDALRVTPTPDVVFTVPRRGPGLLSSARLGGVEILARPVALTFVDAARGPVVEEAGDALVEEQGPYRTVIRRRGAFGPLRWTTRLRFTSGSKEIVADVRLENPAAFGILDDAIPDGERLFRSLVLDVPLLGDGPSTPLLALAGPAPFPRRLAPAAPELPLAFVHEVAPAVRGSGPRLSARLRAGGAERPVDPRAANVLGLAQAGVSATVVVDRCVENAPKVLRADATGLAVELWPDPGDGPAHRFDGGRWKTHRVALAFDAGRAAPPSAADVAAFAARVAHPLRGGVRPAVARATGALPGLWAERRAWSDGAALRFERFFDLLVDDAAADPFPQNERVGLRRYLERGGVYGGWNAFGWENFGDIPWSDGYCDLHYDWPLHPTLGFVRTLDPRFLDVAEDLCGWRRDMGQNHAEDAREWWRGAPFYEKGARHGDSRPGQASHFWLHGLCLWYATTGDEGAYEAALQGLDFLRRNPPGDWNGWWGSRIPGWTIHALVDAHAYLGATDALHLARRGVLRYFEHERATGGRGCVLNKADGRTSPWMECIFFNAAARYAVAAGDRSVLGDLARLRNWLVRDALVEPADRVPHSFSHWAPGRPAEPSVHLLWPLVESLTWSAVLGIDASDDARARRIFDAVACRWQAAAGTPLLGPRGPTPCSPVTFRPAMFPGSESKALANVLLWGAPHLALRAR